MESQEAAELAEYDNSFDFSRPVVAGDSASQIEAWALDYAQAKGDQEELVLTRQYLLLALSKLPKRELKVTLSEQAELNKQPWKLQAKSDDKGTLFFRAVKTFD